MQAGEGVDVGFRSPSCLKRPRRTAAPARRVKLVLVKAYTRGAFSTQQENTDLILPALGLETEHS